MINIKTLNCLKKISGLSSCVIWGFILLLSFSADFSYPNINTYLTSYMRNNATNGYNDDLTCLPRFPYIVKIIIFDWSQWRLWTCPLQLQLRPPVHPGRGEQSDHRDDDQDTGVPGQSWLHWNVSDGGRFWSHQYCDNMLPTLPRVFLKAFALNAFKCKSLTLNN